MNNYIGFSSTNFGPNRTFKLTGKELVKRDLLNHIFTIRGTRPHLPNFGTRIPMLTFEQLDNTLLETVKEDLTNVFNYDPRVKLIDISLNALPANNALVAFVDVLFVELGQQEVMQISFGT